MRLYAHVIERGGTHLSVSVSRSLSIMYLCVRIYACVFMCLCAFLMCTDSLAHTCQMWSPLLEKAFAVHAGGWANIVGGKSDIGLACLTGCTETFWVKNQAKSLNQAEFTYKMGCIDWKTVTNNSSHCKYANHLKKGGFDGGKDTVGPDALFEQLCAWDAANYILCASTGGKPGGTGCHDNKSEGISDAHVSRSLGFRVWVDT